MGPDVQGNLELWKKRPSNVWSGDGRERGKMDGREREGEREGRGREGGREGEVGCEGHTLGIIFTTILTLCSFQSSHQCCGPGSVGCPWKAKKRTSLCPLGGQDQSMVGGGVTGYGGQGQGTIFLCMTLGEGKGEGRVGGE